MNKNYMLRKSIRKIVEGSLSAALNKAVADDPYLDPYESEAQKRRFPKKRKKKKREKGAEKMKEARQRVELERQIQFLEDELDERPVDLREMTFEELLDYKDALEYELEKREEEGIVPFLV